MEHEIHCLPCFNTNDTIDLLPQQLRVHIDVEFISSRCRFAKALSTPAGNLTAAMVIYQWRHLTYNSRKAWHTLYAMLLSNYK